MRPAGAGVGPGRWAPLSRSRLRRWLRVRAGTPVRVSFDRQVREVELTGVGAPRLRLLPRPMRAVVLGRLGEAGSVGVSAVTRTWEQLPPATSVTWFPPGGSAKLLVAPRPGSRLGLDTPLRLRFSEPVSRLLHGRLPALLAPVTGAWRMVGVHELVFTPRG